MKDYILESFTELKEFIRIHDLQNDRSYINFNALVSIETETRDISKQKMTVRVSFNVSPRAGELTLGDHNLSPYEFPEQFYPDYAKFNHMNESYLKIEGTHNHNPEIGKYVVEIYPLGQVKI